MFAYLDAARYRLGVNYQQLPSNVPTSEVYSPYQRDGLMAFKTNYGGDPIYVRSTLKPVLLREKIEAKAQFQHEKWVGEVCDFTSEVTDDDFVQVRALWGGAW